MSRYFVGLMSGTSVDGIDAAVVDFSGEQPDLVFATTYPWPDALGRRILEAIDHGASLPLAEFARLNVALGERFAGAALDAIKATDIHRDQIAAIGCHGQTLLHVPEGEAAFSIQAGEANRIAELTGITTVADFRNRDIAAGGQGAPLASAFHRVAFHDKSHTTAILNIGGIANLTILPPDPQKIVGFDTGPGNTLLDAWHQQHRGSGYDDRGAWAATGKVDEAFLERLLDHEFFQRRAPKSTGRELFNLSWLKARLTAAPAIAAPDVQRTLLEFTARSISDALQRQAPETANLFVCGGGAHNALLMARLDELLTDCRVASTRARGIDPDWVEAIAFAWLAKRTLAGEAGNEPGVTGARRAVVLGAIHPGK